MFKSEIQRHNLISILQMTFYDTCVLKYQKLSEEQRRENAYTYSVEDGIVHDSEFSKIEVSGAVWGRLEFIVWSAIIKNNRLKYDDENKIYTLEVSPQYFLKCAGWVGMPENVEKVSKALTIIGECTMRFTDKVAGVVHFNYIILKITSKTFKGTKKQQYTITIHKEIYDLCFCRIKTHKWTNQDARLV